MSRTDWENVDAICCVLTEARNTKHVYNYLDYFLVTRESLSPDYSMHPKDSDVEFKSEKEMISCYADNLNYGGVFFWNGESGIIAGSIMLGANFTEDGKTIYSITLPADGATELDILEKLKSYFNSEIGMISYNEYPGAINGKEFENECDNTA